MALTVKEQTRYWGIGAALFLLILWLMGNILFPFLAGMALAYFLDPVADRLESYGLSRTMATALITLIAILCFAILLLTVVPMIVSQAVSLAAATPDYIDALRRFISERFPALVEEGGMLPQATDNVASFLSAKGGALLSGFIASAAGVLNTVIFVIVMPVVAFYMLLDWDNMVARIDQLLPRDHRDTIRQIARDIDKVLAGFVRGQVTVCLILGSYYGIALMLAGLRFGLLIGLIAGLISFIPYVGSAVGGGLAIGLALFQFWDEPIWIAVIAGIFVSGQMIEGNYLTPKLVGNSVGLHPVWLMLALSAFGTFFGFTGMLVAVPVTAAMGVIIRFFTAQYLKSRLYIGEIGQAGRSRANEPSE